MGMAARSAMVRAAAKAKVMCGEVVIGMLAECG